MLTIILWLVTIFPCLVHCQQGTAVLYDDINYGGDSITLNLPVGRCRNILEFNDRVSSVRTNVCIRIYEHGDCTGKRIDISPPGESNLVGRRFNDLTTSVSDCYEVEGTVKINMDTSQAPELTEFGRRVKKIMEDWFPFVENLMRTSAYKTVKTIDVFFDPNYDGVAYASGNRIVGAVKYFRNNQQDYGAFIHEMTHVIHQARGCPGWLVEAYAEWTRRWFYEPWTAQSKPNRNQSYKEGYTAAAWLIVYINSAITGKPVIYLLNKACQEDTWYDGIWVDLTGKTVDQLWQDMLNDNGYPWKK